MDANRMKNKLSLYNVNCSAILCDGFHFAAQKKYASIHDAVSAGDVSALETMVKNGASINEVDERDKFTPLHCACNVGALEVCFCHYCFLNE